MFIQLNKVTLERYRSSIIRHGMDIEDILNAETISYNLMYSKLGDGFFSVTIKLLYSDDPDKHARFIIVCNDYRDSILYMIDMANNFILINGDYNILTESCKEYIKKDISEYCAKINKC